MCSGRTDMAFSTVPRCVCRLRTRYSVHWVEFDGTHIKMDGYLGGRASPCLLLGIGCGGLLTSTPEETC